MVVLLNYRILSVPSDFLFPLRGRADFRSFSYAHLPSPRPILQHGKRSQSWLGSTVPGFARCFPGGAGPLQFQANPPPLHQTQPARRLVTAGQGSPIDPPNLSRFPKPLSETSLSLRQLACSARLQRTVPSLTLCIWVASGRFLSFSPPSFSESNEVDLGIINYMVACIN
jgi:hypothetical protein